MNHIAESGFPPGSYSRGSGPEDGVHLVTDGEELVVYIQERGIPLNEFRTKSQTAAHEAMVDLILGSAGLGGVVEFKPVK